MRIFFGTRPNGSRLSCGAELEDSQTEFYHTERKGVTAAGDHGRRQLQALVRLHTEIVARLRPCTAAQSPASPALDRAGRPAGQDRNVARSSPWQPPPARHDACGARDFGFEKTATGQISVIAVGAVRAWCSQQLFAFALLCSLTNGA